MWNVNIRQGTIWTTKSLNDVEDTGYDGMFFGNKYILMLSAFIDIDGIKKYTYAKLSTYKKDNRNYYDIDVKGTTMYIQIDNIDTGDQRALQKYIQTLDDYTFNKIVDDITTHFKILKVRNKKEFKYKVNKIINENNKKEITIHKFGIDINVVENSDVSISKSKRLILSQKAKEDIINCSKNNLEFLCERYSIYPVKAIREIKSRLEYQERQKLQDVNIR